MITTSDNVKFSMGGPSRVARTRTRGGRRPAQVPAYPSVNNRAPRPLTSGPYGPRMPTGVRHLDRFTSTSDDLGPSLPGPPSSAPLLRADEGDRPAASFPMPRRAPVDPVALLVADARTLLLAADDDAVSDRWQDERFAGQVEAVRRHLAPIDDPRAHRRVVHPRGVPRPAARARAGGRREPRPGRLRDPLDRAPGGPRPAGVPLLVPVGGLAPCGPARGRRWYPSRHAPVPPVLHHAP